MKNTNISTTLNVHSTLKFAAELHTKYKDVKTLEQESLSFHICSSSLAYFNRFKVTFPQKIYNSRSDAEKISKNQ